MHSVLEYRKQRQKQYIAIGKTDLLYNSKWLCGNFTKFFVVFHVNINYCLLFSRRARAASEEENNPGTKPKVLSCLKEPPSSMRVDHFASCENIVPRFQTPSIPHPGF